MDDQDRKQRMAVVSSFGVEFYKILTGCFLLFFVPQECEDHACSMSEIALYGDTYYQFTIYFNGFTFLMFLALYAIELYREDTLIKYLDVSPHKARDNDSVEKELERLDDYNRDKIVRNRVMYNNICKICTLAFVANNVFSGMNLYKHQLGSKTTSVFITNILFTGTKLSSIYGIVSADPCIFYSAYMTRKVQYNDVDRDHAKDDEVPVTVEDTLTKL